MRPILLAFVVSLALVRPAAAEDLTGTVVETFDAETYTYVRIAAASGEKWAAIPKAKLPVGAKTTVYGSVTMNDFKSKTLKRSFPTILFGSLEKPGAEAHGMIPGHGAKAPAVDDRPIKVEKAAGPDARTVAELYAQRAAVEGKEVVVRGKIVKITPEVMNLNWIHLRDGSGGSKTGDNDLTVTTKETLTLGKVVTLRGRITLGKDLGGRYKFPVLLEGATLAP